MPKFIFQRDRDLDARGGVLKDKEAEFYNQLAELSESLEFKVADFERFVDTVRETDGNKRKHLGNHLYQELYYTSYCF